LATVRYIDLRFTLHYITYLVMVWACVMKRW